MWPKQVYTPSQNEEESGVTLQPSSCPRVWLGNKMLTLLNTLWHIHYYMILEAKPSHFSKVVYTPGRWCESPDVEVRAHTST